MTRSLTLRAMLLLGALLLATPLLLSAAPAGETPAAASAEQPYAGQSIRVLHDKRPNTANLLDLLPEFEAATGISVTVDIMPESEVFAKEQVELSQQVGTYDVMQYIWLFQPGWERAGWMIDLNPYIEDAAMSFPGWARSDFDDSILGILSVNDKQLGIPFISFTNGLLYNDILLKKYDVAVPTTLEEFEAAAAKLTREDSEMGQIYGYMARGGRRGTEDTNSWIQVLRLFGGDFFDDEWNCALNAPPAVASLEWYVRMVEEYAPPGAKARRLDRGGDRVHPGTGRHDHGGIRGLGAVQRPRAVQDRRPRRAGTVARQSVRRTCRRRRLGARYPQHCQEQGRGVAVHSVAHRHAGRQPAVPGHHPRGQPGGLQRVPERPRRPSHG